MNWHRLVVVASALSSLVPWGSGALAQLRAQNAVTADEGHPVDIASGATQSGLVYTDSNGRTLYAINLRYAGFLAQGGNPLKYCSDECAQSWVAVKATAQALPVGSWQIVDGVDGPQWSYKGDPVFTYVGDHAPGSAAGADRDDLFRLLNYVPPMPKMTAPAPVKAVFVRKAYILEDGQGRALFTAGDTCDAACGSWMPFEAGLAGQGIGEWTIARDADHPQWSYRGQRVYVSQELQQTLAPTGGKVLTARETASDASSDAVATTATATAR